MSHRKHVSLSDDERIGQEAEDELSSSSSDSSSDDEPRRKPRSKGKKTVNARIPSSRRLDIIAKKMSGIEDPEFNCIQNVRTKSWVVRRRKFPLDQTPRVTKQSGTLPPAQVEAPVQPQTQVPVHPPNDIAVSWLNQQASVNDSFKRDLEQLAQNYARLADKYEEKKKKPKKEKVKEVKEVKKDKKEKKDKKHKKIDDDDDEADRELTRQLRAEYNRQLQMAMEQPPQRPQPQREAPSPRKRYGKYPARISIGSY
jgi:hypothetical protein